MKYIPDSIKTYVIAVILALVPLLVANLVISPVFQTSDLDLTLLENKDNPSKLFVIIQNTGNIAVQNILITFVDDTSYKILSFYGTDKYPKDITSEDGILKLEVERLAPQSYLILETENLSTNAKTVWVTSDSVTKFLKLPSSESSTLISSINMMENRELTYLGIAIFGFPVLLIFRYTKFYNSEHARRKYLGIYPIKIVRYRSGKLTASLLILLFGLGGGFYLDNYLVPEPIKDYTTYTVFPVTDIITPKTFLQINDPSNAYSEGSIVAALSILLSLVVSTRDIHLPKFIWVMSKPPSKITLNEISSSYLPAEMISINTKKDISKSTSEILVVKEKNQVIGLITKKGVEKFNLKKKPKLNKIFDEHVDTEHKKIEKNNFIVVKESLNLEELKKQMESESKIYAIIFDGIDNFQGVVEYSDLFGNF